jgi:hypothetical protein
MRQIYVDELNLTVNYIHGHTKWGGGFQSGCSPQSKIFKKTDILDKLTSKVLRDLRFSLNQPVLRFSLNHPIKSADD